MKPTFTIMVLALFFSVQSTVFSQNDTLSTSASMSFHIGMFSISRAEFGNTYHSNAGLTIGGDIGLPLSPKIKLLLKSLYFVKSGIPRIKVYGYVNAEFVQTDEFSEGEATYSQFNIHIGPQYHLPLSKGYEIFAHVGIAVAVVHEVGHRANGQLLVDLDATGYGFFTGVGFERRFNASNWSVFITGDYDVVRTTLDRNILDVGGLNITTGVMKYF